jgi:uncharacterized protein YjbI with pentapeptide repeats
MKNLYFSCLLAVLAIPLFTGVAQAAKPKHLQQLLSTKQCNGCDLSGANLSNIDLSKAQLVGANLNMANLVNTNLSEANLTKASVVGANLGGANLRQTNLTEATFVYSNLAQAQMQGATLYKTDLQGANLANVELTGARISRSSFTNANIYQAKLPGSVNANNNTFTRATLGKLNGDNGASISLETIEQDEVTSEDRKPTNTTNTQTNEAGGGRDGVTTNSTQNTQTRSGRGRETVAPPASSPAPTPAISRPRARRKHQVPDWVGVIQRSTAGGSHFHNPDDPDVRIELW